MVAPFSRTQFTSSERKKRERFLKEKVRKL